MENCINCKPSNSRYATVGKTYYVLRDHTLLCYRHWYQANKPDYIISGEHSTLPNRLKELIKTRQS